MLNPFKAATVMPPNALNSTLITKHKVFLWMDSAQTVLTTCQSSSELKLHTALDFVSLRPTDTRLKKNLCTFTSFYYKFFLKHN